MNVLGKKRKKIERPQIIRALISVQLEANVEIAEVEREQLICLKKKSCKKQIDRWTIEKK